MRELWRRADLASWPVWSRTSLGVRGHARQGAAEGPGQRTPGHLEPRANGVPTMPVAQTTALPSALNGPQLPPISITYGCVRIATVYTWTSARATLRKMITNTYARPMASQLRERRKQHELDQVTAGPVNGMIVTSGSWAWADSIRAAQEGAHGLTAGDLAYLHDFPNGSFAAWTIDVKCKILAITGDSHRVTVRITDQSAVQFSPGDIVTVDATRIRPRAK